MKKSKLFLVIILSLLASNFFISIAKSWPGDGDCREEHGITTANIAFDRSANLKLDGVPSESFWNKEKNKDAQIKIPLATVQNESYSFVVYLNATFIRNSEYIYVLCQWKDNTTKPKIGNLYDGIYFCWNINCPNFSAYFDSGMDTAEMGGGDVDSWDWDVNHATQPNGSSMNAGDFCFGEKSWYEPNLENQDVKLAYTYKEDEYYTVEIQRKLVTNDEYDVQFDETKQYLFNLGIMNDGRHAEHAVSWTYALDFKANTIEGYNPNLSLIIGFLTMISIFILNKTKGDVKNGNKKL
ncbi:MAG: exported protein of unknown function [Promethearchaeota archaeon]|nr:MAG: exported protein of unknown function [Candidatus Lokiarchaeota archaeon]